MKLNDRKYKEFKVSDIFIVKYGVNLELNACEEMNSAGDGVVNFVARTAENNGVSAYVKLIEGVNPQDAGLISVAGGGSVLSTFLQSEPFYSGRDLYTLEAKENISNEAKMFIISVIEKNKYKYSYGRQANKTLPDLLLELPVDANGVPDYLFMEEYIKSLHYKPLTTINKSGNISALKAENWKEFLISDLFDVELSRGDIKEDEVESGNVPLVSSGETNNGIVKHITAAGDGKAVMFSGNKITIDMFGNAYYQAEPFYAVSHGRVNILSSKFTLNQYIGLFIASIIKREQFKYSYGRAIYSSVAGNMIIKLPVIPSGNPDWKFMEDYIKSLPYGDRLNG